VRTVGAQQRAEGAGSFKFFVPGGPVIKRLWLPLPVTVGARFREVHDREAREAEVLYRAVIRTGATGFVAESTESAYADAWRSLIGGRAF